MVDPIEALAFAMHSGKGRYALLLGSGTSSSAGVRTGWGITCDLIEKIGRLRDPNWNDDAERWWNREVQEPLNYSRLLEMLAPTSDERQLLLNGYFQPNPHEDEDGNKIPQEAHRAIAELMRGGYVRVILTTNFDHLIEDAFRAAAVEPQVIYTPAQAAGMVGLAHVQHLVVKVHGDYVDPNSMLNTETELQQYAPEMTRFLDAIFDQFGLITCGWSADYDHALRERIETATNRRFSMYWSRRGPATVRAQSLIDHREAIEIAGLDADTLFGDLRDKVLALEQFSRPHPDSAKLMESAVKRLVHRQGGEITLRDLAVKEAKRVRVCFDELMSELMPHTQDANSFPFDRFFDSVDAMMEPITSLTVNTAYWCRQEHVQILVDSIEILAAIRNSATSDVPNELAGVPAALLQYSAALSAMSGRRFRECRDFLVLPQCRVQADEFLLGYEWSQLAMFVRHIEGKTSARFNERAKKYLRPFLHSLAPVDANLDALHDRLVVLMAIVAIDCIAGDNHPQFAEPGKIDAQELEYYRGAQIVNELTNRFEVLRGDVLNDVAGLLGELSREGQQSPLLQGNWFRGDETRFRHAAAVLQRLLDRQL